MPKFSIVTATRGRPEELRQALVSTLQQECGDFEHLIVDDASSDDASARVIEELDDPRLRLIRLDESRGPAGARNAALEQARGELIAILDDDDAMLPGRLQLAAERFANEPELVLHAGAFEAIDGDGEVHATVHPPTDEEEVREVLPHHNPVCHSTVTVRADVMKEIGGYRESLRYSHDYDMVLRVAEKGRIEIVPQSVSRYRFHADNISTARCFLQGAFAEVARECAERRARGEAEDLEVQVARIRVPDDAEALERARARAQYQIGEWKFKDGRVRQARPHLLAAWKAEPFRPLCLGLLLASYTPAWLRRILAPLVRPLVAWRYKR